MFASSSSFFSWTLSPPISLTVLTRGVETVMRRITMIRALAANSDVHSNSDRQKKVTISIKLPSMIVQNKKATPITLLTMSMHPGVFFFKTSPKRYPTSSREFLAPGAHGLSIFKNKLREIFRTFFLKIELIN